MSLRIRQVKPDFWSDAKLADLRDDVRLFYVGLWMVADDAGWFRWDVPTIAAELYRYQPRTRRERHVTAMMTSLVAIGRIVLHPCPHGYIPKLSAHQRLAVPDRRVTTCQREHAACVDIPNDSTALQNSPRGTERKGNVKGTGGNGGETVQKEETTVTEFQLRVARPA